jgi:hypothetical protein
VRWQAVVLALAFLASAQGVTFSMGKYAEGSSKPESTTAADPVVICTVEAPSVRWHQKGKDSAVRVKIEAKEPASLSVVPSMHLMALPKKEEVEEDEYWSLFNIEAGASTHDWQRLALLADKPLSLQLAPTQMLWGLTKSSASIWPIQKFGKAVPPGRYSLQVQLKTSSGKVISSNEIEINVVK